jgi:hypothetical protein
MRLGQKWWRDPATAELLWHRLQWASYGASGSRPPTAALLAGDPVAEALGANAEGWGLALVLLGGAPVAAGRGSGVEG